MIDEIRNSLEGFKFANFSSSGNKFVPKSLPDNKQCAEVILKAWEDNRAIFQKFGETFLSDDLTSFVL